MALSAGAFTDSHAVGCRERASAALARASVGAEGPAHPIEARLRRRRRPSRDQTFAQQALRTALSSVSFILMASRLGPRARCNAAFARLATCALARSCPVVMLGRIEADMRSAAACA